MDIGVYRWRYYNRQKYIIKPQDLVNLILIEPWPINDQFEDQIEMSSTDYNKINSVINQFP